MATGLQISYGWLMAQVAAGKAKHSQKSDLYCLQGAPKLMGYTFLCKAPNGTELLCFWHDNFSSTQQGCFTVEYEDADGEIAGFEYWPHGAVVRLV